MRFFARVIDRKADIADHAAGAGWRELAALCKSHADAVGHLAWPHVVPTGPLYFVWKKLATFTQEELDDFASDDDETLARTLGAYADIDVAKLWPVE